MMVVLSGFLSFSSDDPVSLELSCEALMFRLSRLAVRNVTGSAAGCAPAAREPESLADDWLAAGKLSTVHDAPS